MGARGTIRLKHRWTDTGLHYYAHWAGPDLPNILAKSLDRVKSAGRVGDENVPSDLSYDTPCVEWTEEGQVIVYIIPVDLMIHGNWRTSDVVADHIIEQWTAEEYISNNLPNYLTSI